MKVNKLTLAQAIQRLHRVHRESAPGIPIHMLHLARRIKQLTHEGQKLDPLAAHVLSTGPRRARKQKGGRK